MIKFDAQIDFHDAMEEVITFLNLADSHESDEKKHGLFIKASLLVFSIKLECFLEDVLLEYLFEIKKLSIKYSDLPQEILLGIVKKHINDDLMAKMKNNKPNCLQDLRALFPYLSTTEYIKDIPITPKFSYGKHGSGEVEKTFRQVGINDIFSKCPVYLEQESLLSEAEPEKINIKGKLDSLTGIRNSITHENKSPNMTSQMMMEYIKIFSQFVDKASALLHKEIELFKEKSLRSL